MADPVYTIAAELVVGSLTNITDSVTRFSFDRSLFDFTHADLRPDSIMVELANASGVYSPKRGGLGAGLVAGRKIAASCVYSGTTYPLFYGRIRNAHTRQSQKGDNQVTTVIGETEMAKLSTINMTASLFQNINAGSLYTAIMATTGVASYRAEAMSDTIGYASYTGTPITTALRELMMVGNYRLYIDGAGTVTLKSRYSNIFDTAVGSYNEFFDLEYDSDPDRIINQMKLNAEPRAAAVSPTSLASITGVISIPAGGSVGFWLGFQDPEQGLVPTPVSSFITPVASTDYYASVNSDGTGSDLTSALSLNIARFAATAVCSIYNASSLDAQLVRFTYRGYPLRSLGQVGFKYDSSSSQNTYGLKALEIANSLIQDYPYLKALTEAIVTNYKEPRERTKPSLINEFPGILSHEVGNPLTLINSVTGVNSDWVITGMRHEVTLINGLRHQADYETEYFSNRPWLVLDNATLGKLDSGRILGL